MPKKLSYALRGGRFIGFATEFYIILQQKTLHCPWDLVWPSSRKVRSSDDDLPEGRTSRDQNSE